MVQIHKKIWVRFSRMSPTVYLFFIGIILIALGLLINFLVLLAIIGAFIVGVYIILWFLWTRVWFAAH